MNVLYLSYDGALDPLGRSQVVPYLEGLAALGHRFDLVTFEKRDRWDRQPERDAMRERLEAAGIRWYPLRYHKRLSVAATAYDLACALRLAARLAGERGIDLVHARSYPPALVAWRLARILGVPYLFDMRGLYAEERVDGGLWPAGGRLYRAAKRLERLFLRDAAAVVTLTEASVPVVASLLAAAGGRAPVEVIPTSVDLGRFRPAPRGEGPFTLAYVGSVGTWYLLEEMLAFGRVALDAVPDARLIFLVNHDPGAVRAAARAAGVPDGRLLVRSVGHDDVPAALAAASATYAFIRPAPSKVASAATKVSESLAMGLPVAVNPGVGDGAAVVESHRVGVVVDPQAPATYPEAVAGLAALARDPSTRDRCRQAARDLFDLEAAVGRYAALYEAAARGPVLSRGGALP